jgi:adenylosuccinate synthase
MICTAYRTKGGELLKSVPASMKVLAQCEPIYETFDGWTEDISKARSINELPKAAGRYLKRLGELSGTKLVLVSVGAGREDTIVLENPFRA